MTTYKFYAGFDGATLTEIRDMDTEEYDIEVPFFPYGEDMPTHDVAVTVVAPKGYELTDKDNARIDELIHEN